jgi:hypothetical protein
VQLLEQLELWEKKRAELEQEEKMMLPQVRTCLTLFVCRAVLWAY